jgi:hypothetical protein
MQSTIDYANKQVRAYHMYINKDETYFGLQLVNFDGNKFFHLADIPVATLLDEKSQIKDSGVTKLRLNAFGTRKSDLYITKGDFSVEDKKSFRWFPRKILYGAIMSNTTQLSQNTREVLLKYFECACLLPEEELLVYLEKQGAKDVYYLTDEEYAQSIPEQEALCQKRAKDELEKEEHIKRQKLHQEFLERMHKSNEELTKKSH